MEAALKVRMREVEKLERVRLESQMKCEKERANREMEEMRAHFKAQEEKRMEEAKQAKCEADSKKKEQEDKNGFEAAKKALEKAQADMKKFENGTANPGCGDCPSSACQTATAATDAELEAKKKEADALIAKLKA